MRIWILRRRFSDTGGAEGFTQKLAGVLHARGHDVWIAAERWPAAGDSAYRLQKISSSGPDSYARACRQQLARNPSNWIFSLERTFRQNIFRAGDGVHACWLERRSRHQSGLQRLWNHWSRKHRSVLNLEKQLFTKAATDWVIANSRMVEREILERFPYPGERIRVIHPGVDLDRFQPCLDAGRKRELRRLYQLPDDAIVWCFVGSGFDRKGLAWAIQIAALQQRPEVWLLVLGKGRRNFHLHLAEKRGFDPRLRFMAEGTRALDVYHASDAFILPTIYDPCSNATLEAAACGLPVITTRGNGAAERTGGILLDDPSRIAENAGRCRDAARPLQPAPLDAELRQRLDDQPCWDALLQLIADSMAEQPRAA